MPYNSKIMFIIEGGEKLGFGHFVRTTQIAEYLAGNANCAIVFITDNSILCDKLADLGFNFFRVKGLNPVEGQAWEISNIIKEENPQQIVIDIKSDHDPGAIINRLKKEIGNARITLIDNITDTRLLADKNIYPIPSEMAAQLDWQGYCGKVYSGLSFFPLRKGFVEAKGAEKSKNSIVVTMGASDPNSLTILLMNSLVDIGRKIDVVIGSCFNDKERICEAAARCGHVFQIHVNPDNYEEILARSSLAVTAVGITLYELAYLQIPTVVIGNYKSDLNTGRILESLGYCRFLGYHKELRQKDIRKAFLNVNEKQCLSMTGQVQLPDGEGVKRLASVVTE